MWINQYIISIYNPANGVILGVNIIGIGATELTLEKSINRYNEISTAVEDVDKTAQSKAELSQKLSEIVQKFNF